MNALDYLLLLLLAAVIVLAIWKIRSDRRQGKGCGGNCAGCMLDCGKKHED